jgi:hypothetical protein
MARLLVLRQFVAESEENEELREEQRDLEDLVRRARQSLLGAFERSFELRGPHGNLGSENAN